MIARMTLRDMLRESSELSVGFFDLFLDMPLQWWAYALLVLLALALCLRVRQRIDSRRERKKKGSFKYQWERMRREEIERARRQRQREIARVERWARESAKRRRMAHPRTSR